jgi:hypothetical protein
MVDSSDKDTRHGGGLAAEAAAADGNDWCAAAETSVSASFIETTAELLSLSRAQMDPASAMMLTLSPNETVTDLASMLKLADSLLRLARFWCPAALFVTSACTSNLL